MNRLQLVLEHVSSLLSRSGHAWCLVGGLAVSARAEPRFTRDLDLAVSVVDDLAAERLVHLLLRSGFRVLKTLEHEALGRLATVRLLPPGEEPTGIIVDLLFASSGIELEIVGEAQLLELLPGLKVPVAGTAHLIALKLLSCDDVHRPQDLIDLRSLTTEATPEELRKARDAVGLIQARGAHRGKALTQLFEDLVFGRAQS